MRRARLPGGLQDVLSSEQQPRALRTANRLAAAVGDDGGAALQVDVGNRQHFGRRIDEDGNVLRPGDACHRLEHRIGPAVGHQVDHRCPRIDGAFDLFDRLDGHHPDADVANRVVVDGSRRTRNDDFGLVETGQIRDANEFFRIAPGDAGDRYVLQPGGATGRDHAPLGPGQLGETAADRVRELVDLNEVFRCGIHRRADFRPLHRSADDRESPAAIDDRLDTKRLIDLRSSHQWSDGRRGLERRVKPAEQGRHRKGIAHQEQFPPCEAIRHFSSSLSRGFAPRTPPHALSRAASPARSVRGLASLRSLASASQALAYFTATREICSRPGKTSSLTGFRSMGGSVATVVRVGNSSGKYCA